MWLYFKELIIKHHANMLNTTEKLFAEFVATPDKLRKDAFGITTEAEFGEKYELTGYARNQLKKRNEFSDYLNGLHFRRLKMRQAEVMETLISEAIEANNPAYMKMFFEYLDKAETNRKVSEDLKEVNKDTSPEKIAERMYELIQKGGKSDISKEDFVNQIVATPDES